MEWDGQALRAFQVCVALDKTITQLSGSLGVIDTLNYSADNLTIRKHLNNQ